MRLQMKQQRQIQFDSQTQVSGQSHSPRSHAQRGGVFNILTAGEDARLLEETSSTIGRVGVGQLVVDRGFKAEPKTHMVGGLQVDCSFLTKLTKYKAF